MKRKRKSIHILLFSFFFVLTAHAQVTVGSDMMPNDGALLDLKQFTTTTSDLDKDFTSVKGLNFPRVGLTDPLKLEPCATTNATNKRAHRGLIVYHTDNTVMEEGLYYWNGGSWKRLLDEVPPEPTNTINLLNLKSASTSLHGTSSGDGGAVLNFGQLTIPENGAYAFNFRLYGPIADITVQATRCVFYISVWVGTELRDIAEINIYAYPNTNYRYTYSVALGANFTAGENVIFKMSHMNEPLSWTLIASTATSAARTSMIWWKL